MRLITFFIVSCLSASWLYGQSEGEPIGFSFGGGVTFDNYYFRFNTNPDYTPVQPGFIFSGGISYGRLSFVEPSAFKFRLELNYSRETTGSIPTATDGDAELAFSRTLFMFWSTLTTPGTFTPFIEIGLGYGQLKIDYTYTLSTTETPIYSRGMSLGVGAGVLWSLSDNITLRGHGQSIYLLRRLFIVRGNLSSVINSPALFTLGVTVTYGF